MAYKTLRASRVPLLLVLIFSSGSTSYHLGVELASVQGARAPLLWISVIVLGGTFLGVVLAGPRPRTHGAVLALEGVISLPLAIVPPWYWTEWFAINPVTQAMATGLVQALALAWLAITVHTAVSAKRRHREGAASPLPP